MNEAPDLLDAAIVGGGITGLSLATLLARRRPRWRVRVFERERRAGGTIGTRDDRGFRTDTGPLGVLADADGAVPLARELGLEAVPASPGARRRWIYRAGGLRPLPRSPREALASELLGPLGKLRAALEPLVPPSADEQSVQAFLARRFGAGAARALAEVLVLGVSAGDPREISADALFPRLRAMEREHGSLLRAMAAGARARRAQGGAAAAPTGLHGFGATGMQALIDRFVQHLGDALRTGTGVRALAWDGQAWRLVLDDGASVRARRVCIAVPAYAAAELLRPLDAGLADGLAAIPYVSMRVVGLGYDRIDVAHPLDGFGFLAPKGQGVRSLGVLFGSTLFPGQAPDDKVQLRALTGGRRDPGMTGIPADAAVDDVRRDLRLALGVAAEPESVTVVDWPRAIPQYTLGHRARAEALVARASRRPGLQLAGNAYFGIGVNDCVRDARRVADAWLGSDAAPGGTTDATPDPPNDAGAVPPIR